MCEWSHKESGESTADETPQHRRTVRLRQPQEGRHVGPHLRDSEEACGRSVMCSAVRCIEVEFDGSAECRVHRSQKRASSARSFSWVDNESHPDIYPCGEVPLRHPITTTTTTTATHLLFIHPLTVTLTTMRWPLLLALIPPPLTLASPLPPPTPPSLPGTFVPFSRLHECPRLAPRPVPQTADDVWVVIRSLVESC